MTGRQCAYAFVQNHGPLGLPAGCNDLRDKQRRHPGRSLLPKRRVSRKQLHSYTYCRRSFLTRAAYPCSFARFPGVPLPHHLWRRTHKARHRSHGQRSLFMRHYESAWRAAKGKRGIFLHDGEEKKKAKRDKAPRPGGVATASMEQCSIQMRIAYRPVH